ncbi:hypothetical protein PybrP1_007611 [[Pythium] brassicae (nom. inval.)]|nr:hypothetical protein PybrP1_007611 [[Pythium] brassicae (nom. inval.)]
MQYPRPSEGAAVPPRSAKSVGGEYGGGSAGARLPRTIADNVFRVLSLRVEEQGVLEVAKPVLEELEVMRLSCALGALSSVSQEDFKLQMLEAHELDAEFAQFLRRDVFRVTTEQHEESKCENNDDEGGSTAMAEQVAVLSLFGKQSKVKAELVRLDCCEAIDVPPTSRLIKGNYAAVMSLVPDPTKTRTTKNSEKFSDEVEFARWAVDQASKFRVDLSFKGDYIESKCHIALLEAANAIPREEIDAIKDKHKQLRMGVEEQSHQAARSLIDEQIGWLEGASREIFSVEGLVDRNSKLRREFDSWLRKWENYTQAWRRADQHTKMALLLPRRLSDNVKQLYVWFRIGDVQALDRMLSEIVEGRDIVLPDRRPDLHASIVDDAAAGRHASAVAGSNRGLRATSSRRGTAALGRSRARDHRSLSPARAHGSTSQIAHQTHRPMTQQSRAAAQHECSSVPRFEGSSALRNQAADLRALIAQAASVQTRCRRCRSSGGAAARAGSGAAGRHSCGGVLDPSACILDRDNQFGRHQRGESLLPTAGRCRARRGAHSGP